MKSYSPEHCVRFDCRKQFRKPRPWRRVRPVHELVHPEAFPCPDCVRPMLNVGHYFRPPKRSDWKAWEVLRWLAEPGTRFSYGEANDQWAVANVREAEARLNEWRHNRAPLGAKLLRRIEERHPCRVRA